MKNKNSHSALTYEQFKALAYAKPDMGGDWIYKLECYHITESERPLYPEFKIGCYPSDKWLFYTFEEAEAYMHSFISNEAEYTCEQLYCFHIIQVPMRKPTDEKGAVWLYDNEGTLQDYQYLPIDESGIERYYGRPNERIRFHKGDIVEVRDYDSVHLAVIVSSEPDINRCWKIYGKCMEDISRQYILDSSDFSATTVDGPNYGYHDHVCPLRMMKPRFPIDENLRAYFFKCCFEPEDLKDDIPQSTGPDMGYDILHEICGLSLYIHHDKRTEFPHLHISNFDRSFLVSLRLDRPDYYPHEGTFTDKLTGNQARLLMGMLTEVRHGKTEWWYLLRKWNDWNDDAPDLQLPLDLPLPDYTKLPK